MFQELQCSRGVCWWAFVAVQKFQVRNKRKCLQQLVIGVLRCDTAYKPKFSDVSECVEGLLRSVSQAIDAELSVPELLAVKRGM